MYDPELAFKTEQDLANDQVMLARIEDRLGTEHPWTQRVDFVVDIFQTIAQKENDWENCFDDAIKEDIAQQITELLEIAREAIDW